VSGAAVQEAIERRTTFNLIDPAEGDKVEFWILTDLPFDRSRFARRQTAEALGLRFFVSAPEDTILMKLHWARVSGGSQKQFIDAVRVYEVQQENLDIDYMNEWATLLGIDGSRRQLRAESTPL
jgi:hypothetical protein